MKYEVIPQIGKEDCGAACVAMIMKNYFAKKSQSVKCDH
ncbi:cysteine peptidase family C39 domain-containing protein [Bacillus sp. TH22]|nr:MULTISPECIES: cysteine peptidase family C39 domain-containing protein [unclassified Bacillus (in: firmicutes)]PYE95687.1 ATP-binding cassette subfamily B protein [Bacillus sp. 196mf]